MNTCHAYGCHTLIHKDAFLCQRHWQEVPAAEKRALERAQSHPHSCAYQIARKNVLQAVARARMTAKSTLNPSK